MEDIKEDVALKRRDRRDKRKCQTARVSLADTFLGQQSKLVKWVVERADREGDYKVLQALDAVASLVEVKGHVTRAFLLVPYIDTPAAGGPQTHWDSFAPGEGPRSDTSATAPAVAATQVDSVTGRDPLVLRLYSGDTIPITEENDGFETAVEISQEVVWSGPIMHQHKFEYYDRTRLN
ncbi:hypothetical protein PHLGIDRAFT_123699 [Phlebiopsis gigantea 11061_1 CR5-6]|uniref:Uncharacterized protein n=1 Tax=Phlebiopsis gigantea (strain 11061_1 CR5-6) TaxID=745531 RepID=A0A0C3S106_PHLG1|nr:hypothetical protein PHLGIDRAFT_123699 [Phlebiopsis gigantea 11061_1 CR5-6]